jgi:hypothetical protein
MYHLTLCPPGEFLHATLKEKLDMETYVIESYGTLPLVVLKKPTLLQKR